MKRGKILALASGIASAILILCGCVNGTDNAQNSVASEQHSQSRQQTIISQDSTYGSVSSQIEDTNVFYLGQYYEDRTWASGKGYILIDKQGNAVAQITGAAGEPSHFDNGYSHFFNVGRKTYYTIDKSGEIVSRFTSDISGERVISYGGGFILTEENVSDFDSAGYQYRVYNVDGSVNGSFILNDSCSANYLGNGVFQVSKGYYCAKGTVWIPEIPYDCYPHLVNALEFDGDNIIIGTTASNETRIPGILVLSAYGKIWQYYPDGMSIWSTVSALSDGVCVIYNNDGEIISYNILTGRSSFLGEEYWKRRLEDSKPQTPKNGRIPVSMKGADGKTYSAIFDTEFNLIADTQLGNFCGASDGRFVTYIRDSDNVVYSNSKLFITRDLAEVYNSDGEFVFSISDRGFSTNLGNTRIENYSCGALLVVEADSYHRYYIDTDGKLLFDHVKFDNVKCIDIE